MQVAAQYDRAMRAAIGSVAVSAALAVVKLVTGVLGNSYALIADAIESLADVFAAAVVWAGLRVARRPADKEHPYGHGKAEPLAALVVAFMLLGAAIGIAIEAVREIRTPHHAPAAYTLWVLISVVIVKELVFRLLQRVARRAGSAAVELDAWHHRGDALTSLAAAVGISIALWGGPGYESADDWAALLAAAVIGWNALRLMRTPLQDLMDAGTVDFDGRIGSIARGVDGVRGVEKIIARRSGMHVWVDMHLEVDPLMTVREAHRIAHAVKDAVRAALPQIQDVLIHIEPLGEGPSHGEPAGRCDNPENKQSPP